MRDYYLSNTMTKLGDGVYSLEHIRYGKQLWSICKVRKDHVCAITSKPIKKGGQAYRPITNSSNRYERIARAFFEANR